MQPCTIEFFWDAVSPYTYLASTQIDALAERCGAELIYRPFLIGAAFKATGNAPPPVAVPAKGKYLMDDIKNYAAYLGVPLNKPAGFPINSLLPMRTAVAAMRGTQGPAYAKALMATHWGAGRDVSQAEVIAEIAASLGMDGTSLLEAATEQATKDELRANCESAISRGAFGAPTFFVNQEIMFFGQDRLPILEAFVLGKLAA